MSETLSVDPAPASRQAPSSGASWTKRSIVGSAWTLLAYGGSQLLRLASNLILTRLLAPEYFGLMAMVNVFIIGVNMFSDIGIGANLVQSSHGNDRRFVDTAWTLQSLRGGAIWLLCVIGAWPFAVFYREPQLVALLIASGLSALIAGFNSTKLLTAYRELSVGRVNALDLGSQALTVVFTIVYAWWSPSVWALVNATLFSAVFKLMASHWLLPGENNRFAWDRGAVIELVGFGKWIFLSTALGFFASSAGNLILGRFVSMKEVGIYTIALSLSNIVGLAYEQIGFKILFPLYAKLKELPLDQLRMKVFKIRLAVMALFLPPLWILSVGGQKLVSLLLDARYSESGWILRLLATCAIPSIVTGTGPFYLAMGDSRLLSILSALKLVAFTSAAGVGWYVAGAKGILVGMASHTLVLYVAEAVIQRRYRIWLPSLDIVAYLASAVVVGVGVYWQGGFL